MTQKLFGHVRMTALSGPSASLEMQMSFAEALALGRQIEVVKRRKHTTAVAIAARFSSKR